MEYKFTIQIQMEFRQDNGTMLTSILPDECIEALPEIQHKNLIENQIEQVLLAGRAPFIVLKEYNLRRESTSVESKDLQKRILTYNRKQKSLAELSKKFLNKFQGHQEKTLALDQVTKDLKVERRRIYDIINIMESLGVVGKEKKNIYQWKGLEKAVQTINLYKAGFFFEKKQKIKKQKSLQSLAGEFLRLFLTYKSILTLDEATSIILTDADEKMRKTKIRRLYDIVNVFKCLGLVRKVHLGTGKNGFQWLGIAHLKDIIEKKKNQSFYQTKTQQIDPFMDSDLDQSEKQNFMQNQKFDEMTTSKKNCEQIKRKDTMILTDETKMKKEELSDRQKTKIQEIFSNSYFSEVVKSLKQDHGETVSELHRSLSGILFPCK